MLLLFLLKCSIILLICMNGQIQPAISQILSITTHKPILRKHESMCQQYKSQIFEKKYIISGLVFGRPEYENTIDTCAPSKPFIVGGTAAKSKEFPHMARLGYTADNGLNTHWFCGGTLISNKFVLSAAHCFVQSEEVNRVRLGELVFGRTDDDARTIDFDVKDYFTHPNYTYEYDYYDIALVELNGSVNFSEYVAPACLPVGDGEEYDQFLAVGWGSTDFSADGSDQLLKVTLDRYNGSKCNEYASRSSSLPRGLVEREQLCAGSAEKKDTCTGDSGGPLLQYSNIKCMYQVVGVTSTGPGCGISNVPGIYTRVHDYNAWIENIVW